MGNKGNLPLKSVVERDKNKMPLGILSTPMWLCILSYQKIISPVIHIIPGSGCRFYPTCSEYTKQAIAMHGAFRGFILGCCRIIRCNPLCEGGFDYVPIKFEWKKLFSQNKVDETRRNNN